MLSAGAVTMTIAFTIPTRHPKHNVSQVANTYGDTQKGPVVNMLDTNGTERHLAQDRAATSSRNPLICDKLGGTA